jgi:outer membrane biogenesis lipoprotein LolB
MIRIVLLCLLLTACATPAQRERQQIDDALRVPNTEGYVTRSELQ